LDASLGKLAEWIKEKPIKRNLSKPTELKQRELTAQSYDEEKPPASVNVAPGHEIGKAAIKLLIASVGKE